MGWSRDVALGELDGVLSTLVSSATLNAWIAGWIHFSKVGFYFGTESRNDVGYEEALVFHCEFGVTVDLDTHAALNDVETPN